MAEGTAEGALAQFDTGELDAVETIERVPVYCSVCGSNRMRRVHRKGFLQLNIYPLLGYYPWRCGACGMRVMLRKRHRQKALSSRK
ncbi:MAG: hypothetical protein ACP5E2_09790 [Terracidiphilus sp.]